MTADAASKDVPTDCNAHQLDRLYTVIEARRGAEPSTSHSARLLSRGTLKCAQKMGEEAVETVIAAASGDRAGTISESADLLYHWLVLMTSMGISPDEVYKELARREGRSGIDEKASRTTGP
ncbi:MAG: phosphoribosyl-ATP diphosphatase [Parvibaculaceae bacterium]|nr:phosphoribosyl-ATP diphosphatase [Parvibaculaceae bacterium]